MLSIENISLFFGERPILRRLSVMVAAGERLCLVGPNGAGKSTLLKVCAGELMPEEGEVNKPKDAEIGYLPQDVDLPADVPLLEEVMSVFAKAQEALDEMRDLEHKMGEVDHTSQEFIDIAERYDFLQHEVTRLDAWTGESRAARVLHGLGFSDADYEKRCGAFSGGWRMRAALAKVLLRQPEIMLLDEPTNYLDIETMLWLEEWLKASTSAIMFVSHERAFMDNLADRVVEIAAGQHSFFKGNYSTYLELRQERREQQQAAFENQQSRIKQIEDYAAKFRAKARRASGVQSRLKEIDRMDRVEAPHSDPSTIHFRFPPAPRGNKIALELRGVTKTFGSRTVLKDIDFQLVRGEKVAIVGMNGAGKSTLIKLLAGDHTPDTGERKTGDMTALSYFAQDQLETLSPSNTVYGELLSKSVAGMGNFVRDLAGAFLFKGDDIDKPVSVLSGGEKTRLRIAKMLMGTSNCLLLDEPTNHLDVQARGVLERALKNYDGAFLIVSHDRIFVDQVATKIYEVKDGKVTLFPGSYADYVEQLQDENEELGISRAKSAEDDSSAASSNGSSRAKGDQSAFQKGKGKPADEDVSPREARQRLKKLDEEHEAFEVKSTDLEERIAQIELAMTEPDNYTNGTKMGRLQKELAAHRKTLDKLMERWVKLEEEREELTELAQL